MHSWFSFILFHTKEYVSTITEHCPPPLLLSSITSNLPLKSETAHLYHMNISWHFYSQPATLFNRVLNRYLGGNQHFDKLFIFWTLHIILIMKEEKHEENMEFFLTNKSLAQQAFAGWNKQQLFPYSCSLPLSPSLSLSVSLCLCISLSLIL